MTTLPQIVVTAQRREQNVQDVPIAVTALTQAELATNRVVSVNDLNLLAPGLTVVPSAGGVQQPAFTMRGVTSYGTVPGSDKAISTYIDGVYVSAGRAGIFDLPDIAQLEVLRGPQGTLFGRNAIAGAMNITTRDPSGRFSVIEDLTGGNYNQFRSRTTLDTPSWGPFSAYLTFVHNERQGDIKNLGAGTVWSLANATGKGLPSTYTSPKYLGSDNSNDVFFALKFQPTDWFSTVYKFDYSDDHFTPAGDAYLGGPLIGSLVAGGILHPLSPFVSDPSGKRPTSVNNAETGPGHQIVQGQSLVSKIVGDNFEIKNIAAYRQSYIISEQAYDGLPAFSYAPPSIVVLPAEVIGLDNQGESRQWSDELQYIYHSKLLTLTVGALVFQERTMNGGIPGLSNNVGNLFPPPAGQPAEVITTTPSGAIELPAGKSDFYNLNQSLAAYTQVELHVTSQVDIVAGIRENKDWKSGSNDVGNGVPAHFTYTANAPSYLLGVNYKPTSDIMLYAKYSTAFVSGGQTAGIPWLPETVQSWEAGLKAEFLDHHLRTNLSIYNATYYNLQDAAGGSTYAGTVNPVSTLYPYIGNLGTFVIDQGGPVKANGVEFEGTWIVTHGVTLGASLDYTDVYYTNVNPLLDNPANVPTVPTLLPRWSGGLWGNYATTFADGLKGSLRIDAQWRSTTSYGNSAWATDFPYFASYITQPSTWIVNARAVLGGFRMRGVDAEVAVWGKNLTDDRSLSFPDLIPQALGSSTFQPARTFGVDVHFKY